MEIITFAFIGLSLLSFIKYGHLSQGLITYFLLQSGLSMLLLFSLISSSSLPSYSLLAYLSLLAKLGVLPFGVWVFPIISQLSGSVLFYSMTIQKLPVFVILMSLSSLNALVSLVMLLNLLLAGLLAFSAMNKVSLLIFSSVANNSWIWLSLLSGSYFLFILFYLVYILGVYFTLFSSRFTSIISLISLSGLPPFPLFFVKLLVILSVFNLFSNSVCLVFLFIFLIFTLFIRSSYIRLVSSSLVYNVTPLNYVS